MAMTSTGCFTPSSCTKKRAEQAVLLFCRAAALTPLGPRHLMTPMKPSLIAVLAAVPLLSGCASWSNWYSQTPVGIRHTRMMVDSEQEYAYYVDPVRPPDAPYRDTPLDRLWNFLTNR